MEEFYPYTLTIHLLCAILFIGYLFVDVFVLGVVKKKNVGGKIKCNHRKIK